MRCCRPLATLAAASVMLAACQTGRGRVVSEFSITPQGGWLFVDGVPFVAQRSERDCGAAALAMVLRYWRVDADVDGLVAAVPAARDRGLKAGELRELARARGLDAFVIKGEPDHLLQEIRARRPIIVGLAQRAGRETIGHYEVVIGFNHARLQILTLDPAAGWRVSSYQDFAAEWAGAQQLTLIVFRRAR
ncbi:MAG TPA: cysteine peptidase family C39 domain-containing protein [Polyangia bacterium]|nr:cysteine peptidase family C39 domain-containing protein [Polyangia bacterium]